MPSRSAPRVPPAPPPAAATIAERIQRSRTMAAIPSQRTSWSSASGQLCGPRGCGVGGARRRSSALGLTSPFPATKWRSSSTAASGTAAHNAAGVLRATPATGIPSWIATWNATASRHGAYATRAGPSCASGVMRSNAIPRDVPCASRSPSGTRPRRAPQPRVASEDDASLPRSSQFGGSHGGFCGSVAASCRRSPKDIQFVTDSDDIAIEVTP